MKAIPVGEAQVPLNLDEDSPELEAELLKAAKGPFSTYASEELREACQHLIRDKHGSLRRSR